MIRLVCIDVDGTLVGSAGRVHPAVWTAAARARAAGVRLAICTGRPGFGISRDFAVRLDADGWHVFQNGASVVHLPTGRSLSARMAPEAVAMLVARARAADRPLELYTDRDYAVEPWNAVTRAHAALLRVPFEPGAYEALSAPVVRGQWLLSHAEAAAVLAEPHPGLEVSPSTSPMMPDTQFVNLTPAGVDKASAVRAVAAEYGFSLDEVMFVGDGQNDASAMRIVGCAVAVANAEPDARAAAGRHVAHVDEGGLAEALELAAA